MKRPKETVKNKIKNIINICIIMFKTTNVYTTSTARIFFLPSTGITQSSLRPYRLLTKNKWRMKKNNILNSEMCNIGTLCTSSLDTQKSVLLLEPTYKFTF